MKLLPPGWKFDRWQFALGFVGAALLTAVVAYALTSDQIFSKVYDSVNNALRINQVTP
jgi:hypothetical protein